MKTRRNIFALLCFFPSAAISALRKPKPAPQLAPMSFDAEEWAREFVAHVRINPLIATDEGTMTTWFANALVRGYDEACWRYQDEMSRLRTENDHLTRDLFTQKEFPAREVSAIEGVPTICL